MSKTYIANLSLQKIGWWYLFIISPTVLIFSLIGLFLSGFNGALQGVLFAIIVGAGVVLFLSRQISKSGIIVETDGGGISLSYAGVKKSLARDDIKSVTLTRSIFWKNLIRLDGNDTRIILNLNLQPRWQELISDLSANVPVERLKDFKWEQVRV